MIQIREATPADADRLIELIALGAVPGAVAPRVDADLTRAALAEIAADPRSAVLVAEEDGVVIGTLQLIVFRHVHNSGGLCAEIESVHVHPDVRGQGVGGLLLDAAVEQARATGCYRVQLTSNAARPDAHRFYERHGFTASHVGFKQLL